MTENKRNTQLKDTVKAILLVTALSVSIPVYCETTNNNPVQSLSVPSNESPETTSKEVKQLSLPGNSPANNASGSPGKVRSSKLRKNKTKSANEIMSSDDTTPEYIRSIDPNLHYEKARRLAFEKKYNEALKEVNQALLQNPKYYEAKYLGAVIYERQGRKQEAANRYRQLLTEKPNYLQARISYASVLADLGQEKEAEVEFKKAIELEFVSCEAHYNFANLLTKENRFKEALSELRICLKLKPDNAAVHNNLGVIYFHQNHKEASEKEFLQASELDPANKIYVRNLELVRSGEKSIEAPSLG